MNYTKSGIITHYFGKIQVAVMKVTDVPVKIGYIIRIGEEDTGLEQRVESMQVDHNQVEEAKVGDEVGLKVSGEVKPDDVVYIVTE